MATQTEDSTSEKSIDRDSVDRDAEHLRNTRDQRLTVDFPPAEATKTLRLRRVFSELEATVDEHGRFRIQERDSPENFLRTQDVVDLEGWR